jgi:hypothetical protein
MFTCPIDDLPILMNYESEAALVESFVTCLGSSESPWGDVKIALEFDYQRGRTDVVAVAHDGHIVAFEAKLDRWRDALNQAYRNTCFAHRSYIVVPQATAHRAARYHREFVRRKVGLCYVENGRLEVLLEPPLITPILPWLCERVNQLARSSTQAHVASTCS